MNFGITKLWSRVALVTAVAGLVLSSGCGGGGSNGGTQPPPPPTTYTLTVNSAKPNSGVAVTVSPNDNNLASSGSTSFTRTYNSGTTVTLTALTTVTSSGADYDFTSWSGCDSTTGTSNSICTVAMNATKTVTANYNSQPPQFVEMDFLDSDGSVTGTSPVLTDGRLRDTIALTVTSPITGVPTFRAKLVLKNGEGAITCVQGGEVPAGMSFDGATKILTYAAPDSRDAGATLLTIYDCTDSLGRATSPDMKVTYTPR